MTVMSKMLPPDWISTDQTSYNRWRNANNKDLIPIKFLPAKNNFSFINNSRYIEIIYLSNQKAATPKSTEQVIEHKSTAPSPQPQQATTPESNIPKSDNKSTEQVIEHKPTAPSPQPQQATTPESNIPKSDNKSTEQVIEHKPTAPSPQSQQATTPDSNEKVPFMRRVASLISRFTRSVFDFFKSLFKKKSI